MSNQSLWNGIIRMATISHSIASDNQRALQKAMTFTSEFTGDPNAFLPKSVENVYHSDFQTSLVKNFEQATGLVVSTNA
jgi:hypothetical protein